MKDKSVNGTVTGAEAGRRLDRWLADHFSAWSRTRWQAAVRSGAVRVDGRPIRHPSTPLEAGQTVQAEPPRTDAGPMAVVYEAPQVPIAVRFQDDHLLVVAKPRGMVVHPAPGHAHETLVQGLWPALADAAGDPVRPGVVHRLDRDTTGLLILARHAAARMALSGLIADRAVERRYWALIRGHLEPAAGRIEAPIGRDPRHRLRMAAVAGGRRAVTGYRTLATWPGYALVELSLETGRTHQIRVHLAHLGHPVVGDGVYGYGAELGFTGQALHAYHLAFVHPFRPERLVFCEPAPDWDVALDRLGPPRQGALPAAIRDRLGAVD